MKATTNMTNQGGPSPTDTPKPKIRPPEDPNPERKDPEPSEPPGNPNPDSQPNEIRATDADYRYRGGRQGVGEVPNPREVREDAEIRRRTADQHARDDAEPRHDDSQTRNPE